MTGETNLATLLKTAKPEHIPGDYVFCTVADVAWSAEDEVVMAFTEREGTTLILTKAWADRNRLAYSFVAAWITLTVHSSLAAVGLTAAFSTALASRGIP